MRTVWAILFAVVLAGCGGGGGGGDNGDDELALLVGRWFGPALGGDLSVAFDGAGQITELFVNSVLTGETGAVQRVSSRYFEGQLTNGDRVRLFLDPTGAYAAFYGDVALAALQKGATPLSPVPHQVSDIAPDDYVGTSLVTDNQYDLVDRSSSDITIAADGSYAGSDSSGLTFGSPAATVLATVGFILQGPYEDSAHAAVGFIDILYSPDAQFLVGIAFPETNGSLSNSAFIAAWNRQ